MGNEEYSRKLKELFLQWKVPPNSQKEGRTGGASSSTPSMRRQHQALSNSCTSFKSPPPIQSLSQPRPRGRAFAENALHFHKLQIRQPEATTQTMYVDEETSKRRQDESLHGGFGLRESSRSGRPPSSLLLGRQRGMVSPSDNLSTHGGCHSSAEINAHNHVAQTAVSQLQRQSSVLQVQRNCSMEDTEFQEADKVFTSSRRTNDTRLHGFRRTSTSWTSASNDRSQSLPITSLTEVAEDEEDAIAEVHEENEEGETLFCDREQLLRQEEFSSYNDDLDDRGRPYVDEEEEFPNAIHEEGGKGGKDMMVLEDLMNTNESTKRRERRQAQAAREREGHRRRKEGLPRNFLLVDEYTRKPYGVGVGDWRKELMLMSKDLDPSIGNINQQPPRAVEETAEWIQHTWQYSAPVKFEYVKEVVARGVSLRRAELWKKIRNRETKPEKLSDRMWCTLSRQMRSPAIVKKSETCSRANASRVNFGRTRPSGEVGVQERLRRKLRRSLELEEIRYEMARDKGYGGRSKRRKTQDNVMHGSEPGPLLISQGPEVTGRNGMRHEEGIAEDTADNVTDAAPVEATATVEFRGANTEKLEVGGHSLGMSEEDIAKHPFVMKMMERLEVLEGRQNTDKVGRHATQSEHIQSRNEEPQHRVTIDGGYSHEKQGTEGAVQQKVNEVRRRPGRPRKRTQDT